MNKNQSRKQPQQERSRVTVTAILDAMIRILDREGVHAATTTRVAEVAGISIGTLYQYFSHRDAILDALQDREFERALDMLQRELGENARESPREIVRGVLGGLLSLYAAAPALHRVLAVEGLRVTPAARVEAFDMRVVGLVRSYLAARSLPIRRSNVDAAAFVVFQSVRAAMLARLLESPPGLDDDTLTEELGDLVLRYLVHDSEQAASPPPAAARPSPRSRTQRRI